MTNTIMAIKVSRRKSSKESRIRFINTSIFFKHFATKSKIKSNVKKPNGLIKNIFV